PGFVDLRLVRNPADGTLNELDEHALEAALSLAGDDDDEVIALTLAPTGGDIALRKAFQMGAKRGIRIADESLAGSDFFGTAGALAQAIRTLGAEAPIDLVVCGMTSLDGLGSVIPTLVATDLGWPGLTHAASVELRDTTLTIERHADDLRQTWSAPLPLVLSVTDAANTPRLPNFQLIMAARTRPIEVWSAEQADIEPTRVGTGAARAVLASTEPAAPRPAPRVIVDHGDGGAELARFLIDSGFALQEAAK
ncbi:MAG: electron transfer flavoprotein subunit beta, partial [Promicromonosporaceae bacterium]|nr:electron transfer flavoprotein subunit beta [Promicromonosporaceae bacterium]